MVHELPKELIHNNNNNENENGNGKKFAVLLCAEDSQYLEEKYDGKYGLFVSMLRDEGESWDVFRAMRNEFPNDDEIQMYDGFVLTGSIHNAYSNDLWICNLLSLLTKLDFFKKKILGICFGHQILGRLLGGKIVQASSGWDFGLRTIHFSPLSYKVFSNLKIPSTLNIIQCHQDVILEMPAKVEVIGVSNKTSIEMFRYGDHMLGIQGHPEYNRDILAHLIGILRQKDLIGVNYADKMLAKCMESRDPDKEAWRKLCVSFLKGRS